MSDSGDDHLHYDLHDGSGPYAMLVHGFLSSRAQWIPNLDAMSRVARPVVVELYGHGRSSSPADTAAYAPSHYVAEFERIREELGAERWVICGQSLGAALTLRYALDHADRVIAQVFTNSMSALAEEGWIESVRPGLEAQARQLETGGRAAIDGHPLNPANNRRLPSNLRNAFVRDNALLDARGLANCGLYTVPASSVRADVMRNTVPALLVAGRREARFAPHARWADEHVPHLRVVQLDGGHAVNLDAAEEFNAAVTQFIEEHAAARARVP